jgi:hypothetical protein
LFLERELVELPQTFPALNRLAVPILSNGWVGAERRIASLAFGSTRSIFKSPLINGKLAPDRHEPGGGAKCVIALFTWPASLA